MLFFMTAKQEQGSKLIMIGAAAVILGNFWILQPSPAEDSVTTWVLITVLCATVAAFAIAGMRCGLRGEYQNALLFIAAVCSDWVLAPFLWTLAGQHSKNGPFNHLVYLETWILITVPIGLFVLAAFMGRVIRKRVHNILQTTLDQIRQQKAKRAEETCPGPSDILR